MYFQFDRTQHLSNGGQFLLRLVADLQLLMLLLLKLQLQLLLLLLLLYLYRILSAGDDFTEGCELAAAARDTVMGSARMYTATACCSTAYSGRGFDPRYRQQR